jgi:hypothetical protein
MDRYNDRTSTATVDDISDLARELERIKQDLRQLRGDIVMRAIEDVLLRSSPKPVSQNIPSCRSHRHLLWACSSA